MCCLSNDILEANIGRRVCDVDAADLKFKKITPEDMRFIWPYLKREGGRTCDFSYGGILMWVEYFNYEYTIFNDTLFIKGVLEDNRAVPAFSIPVGRMTLRQGVELLGEYCRRKGMALEFSAVPEYAVEELVNAGAKSIVELTDWGDYIYDINVLATLRGKKMAKKRNHVNQFATLYPDAIYLPLTPDKVDAVLDFMDSQEALSDQSSAAKAEREMARKVVEMMRDPDFPMQGGVLEDKGRIVAFSAGDVKGDTLFVHIEKADRDYAGSYEMINKAFVCDMLDRNSNLKYVNREDDGGDEGLRQAKMSYRPLEILRKYNVVF